MSRFILIVLISLSFSKLYSQRTYDTIQIVQEKSKMYFVHDNKALRFVDLPDVLKPYSEARKYYKYANINRMASYVLIGYAVIGIGYSATRLAETGDLSYLLSGGIVAGSYVLISIPLSNGYKKNTRKAIEVYNEKVKKYTSSRTDLKLGFTSSGFGLVYSPH